MRPFALPTAWLRQESQALLNRLALVKPFVLHETMVPAAALSPAALIAIEDFLLAGRQELRHRVLDYLDWLDGAGRDAPAGDQQLRFTAVRWRFNDLLTQFDVFHEAITQRSESGIGIWLSGLDVAAAEALRVPGQPYEAPPVITYLDRGPGAAIRRARTRLPGGDQSPVALLRVPRERMIGHGIASSLVHEVGHQGAALLNVMPSVLPEIREAGKRSGAELRLAWTCWERWVSEVIADFWSVGKLGVASTLGLIGVVSLPRPFVFRINLDDPHPAPWIRVRVSCAIGEALYPHPQWQELAALWTQLYPMQRLGPQRDQLIGQLLATIPEFVSLLLEHRPPALGGRRLRDLMPAAERAPDQLAACYRSWAADPELVRETEPTLAFAVIGQARAAGALAPDQESRILADLLTHWALRSTLDSAQSAQTAQRALPQTLTTSKPKALSSI